MSKDAMMGVRDLQGIWPRRLRPSARPDKPAVALLAFAACFAWSPAMWAQTPELQLPIACTPGKDCFVQNYPDDDTAPGSTRDFACGHATYDGHDGTDIRVLSVEAAKSVEVLAAAAGKVRGMRDGEPDHLMRTPADKAALKGRECGNGVAIVHGGGWETQYCHLRKGSVRVREGQQVATGEALGEVGQSGETQFAHVHLTVRQNGKPVDPFTGKLLGVISTDCPTAGAMPLWTPAVAAELGKSQPVILEAGFTDRVPTSDGLEEGHSEVAAPTATSGSLMLYGRVMHLRKGDRVRVRIQFPTGPLLDQTTEPSARDRAMQIFTAARKRAGASWGNGRYAGTIEVLQGAEVVAKSEAVLEMK